ncbi:MAG: M48 family metallopeptidase [Alphaproteobacteria bacterium]|nr:M48 family metallopeptidase [Alphaproteobacteria bacterium]
MSEFEFTTSAGEKVPIVITVKRGLRNITLRPHAGDTRVINVSRPWLATTGAVMKFIEQKHRWLDKFFMNAPTKAKLKSGDRFDFLDRKVMVIYDATIRGTKFVLNDNGMYTLFVGGDGALLENRVRTFIKSELLKEIRNLIRKTPREFWPRRICLRDTSSRWGSCSTTGTISFSWRLAFAPYDVMRYVVMHELSHTKHMNHSPEFWAQVHTLYGFGIERAKRWLNTNGAQLHALL